MCVFSNSFSRYNTTEKLFTRVSYDAHERVPGSLDEAAQKKRDNRLQNETVQYVFCANLVRFPNVHMSAADSDIINLKKYLPISRSFNELFLHLLLRDVQVHPSLHDVQPLLYPDILDHLLKSHFNRTLQHSHSLQVFS